MTFIHLHGHSEYSLWDGLAKVDDLVARAKEIGQNTLAITDHGNISCLPEFYKAAKGAGIIPIIGMEGYMIPDVGMRPKKSEKNKDGSRKRAYYHLGMLAIGERGYQSLVQITSLANTPEGFYYKGRIDFPALEGMRGDLKHIIALTGCESGYIASAVMSGKMKVARKRLEYMRWLFPNLYVEIMKHPSENEDREKEQDELNATLVELADRYNLPVVITNDYHYVLDKQQRIHRTLVTSASKGTNKNPDADLFGGTGYYLKSEDEMRAMYDKRTWRRAQESFKIIEKQTENFHIKLLDEKKWYIPKFPRKDSEEISSIDKIHRMCRKKLKLLGLYNKLYRDRLKTELEVIHRANFEEEFLIVRDYIGWARRNGIYVGAGRGSMAGVLVAFLLNITDVDPIKYDLLFERAINPARPSLPDFDVDFQAARREEVVEYITEKWGAANVLQVCTFNAMAPKGAVRAVLRALDVPYVQMVQATRNLPDTVEIIGERKKAELKDILEEKEFLHKEAPELEKLMKEHPRLKKWAIGLQGTIQSYGTHAAGVVISDGHQSLRQHIPTTYLPGPKRIVTQYDMAGVKSFGFVKFDILGLSTLDTIADAIAIIGKDPFAELKDFEDQETFDMLNAGRLTTVFQLQGFSCRMIIKSMGIKTFEDIIAINALSRPGATKFVDAYHQQRDHPKRVKYLHPKLKPIMEKSNGVLLYQEQTMQIALDIAGWDHHITDDLKEAIKYKKSDVFKVLRPKFIEGCIKNDVSADISQKLWDLIRDASGYQFNRAHSVSYAILGFQTAYLKKHYPAAWYAAYLRNTDTKSTNAKGKLSEVMQEARSMGVNFLPPEISKSGISFTVEDENKIRFGLSEVKGVGAVAAQAIVDERRGGYRDVLDVMGRVPRRHFNSRAKKALEDIGALESIGAPSSLELSERQLSGLGIVLDFHIPKRYRRQIERYLASDENKAALESEDDEKVVVGGIITHVQKHTTKKGDLMARVRVDYYTGSWELAVFPRQYDSLQGILKNGAVVLVQGLFQRQWGSIALDQLIRLDKDKVA